MLRYEPVAGILRFYAKDVSPGDYIAVYEASCTVVWETPEIVWLKGLSGKFTKRHMLELIRFVLDNKITKVKSYRNSGSLPFATFTDGRYCEIDVLAVMPKITALLERDNVRKETNPR
jgi:hypothetical protein